MVGVEQWAEVRRLVLVERQVAKSLGVARDTVARALASGSPPRYERPRAGIYRPRVGRSVANRSNMPAAPRHGALH